MTGQRKRSPPSESDRLGGCGLTQQSRRRGVTEPTRLLRRLALGGEHRRRYQTMFEDMVDACWKGGGRSGPTNSGCGAPISGRECGSGANACIPRPRWKSVGVCLLVWSSACPCLRGAVLLAQAVCVSAKPCASASEPVRAPGCTGCRRTVLRRDRRCAPAEGGGEVPHPPLRHGRYTEQAGGSCPPNIGD